MKDDLTQGSVLKKILVFVLPFLIGNLFQQLYNMADMVIVGQTLGTEAYTAIGTTSSVMSFAINALANLTLGFSLAIAHAFGAKDEDNIRANFAASIKLSVMISVPASIVLSLSCRSILELLRTPEELIDMSHSYLLCIFAGLLATTVFNLLSNVIRALGDSKTPLYFLIIASVINIALDYVFLAVFHLGTAGAGLATVIAQIISSVLCIIYIVKKQPALHLKLFSFKNTGMYYKKLLRLGVPMAFLNMVLSCGAIITQFVTNGFATPYITAQTTAAKLENFAVLPLVSLGSAVSVFTAQNYGAKKYDRVLKGAKATNLLGWAWWLVAFAIMFFFSEGFVALLAGKTNELVIKNGSWYMLINTALMFIMSPLHIWKCILQPLEHTLSPLISGFTEVVGRAGTSFLVMWLVSSARVSEADGFLLLCFSNPCAWLLGILTVILDYIFLMKKIKKSCN